MTRYAFGLTLSTLVALGVAWPVSFLTPVLACAFLAAPKALPLRGAIGFVGIIAVACASALLLCNTLQYPGVFFPLSALGLFLIQYAQQRGGNPIATMWFTVAWVLIPFMGVQSMAVASLIAGALLFGTTVAIVLVWCAFMLFPDPEQTVTARPAPTPAIGDPSQHFAAALRNTLAVLPAFMVFHLSELTSHALVLIFVALLSGQPAFQKGFKGGAVLLLGNGIGGIGAVIIFNLLTVAPSMGFLALLIAFASLWFGARSFSDQKTAPLFKTGMSTLLLIVGSATTSTGEAGALVYTRLAQLAV
ncbi:MAG: DUF2955 domain-containing protein, partial [Deltaproteobacteria bacterium]|nr:DUF2955 domain-containing protein [Deltaproteobacteria bacterium]